jgi:hypothetical protein
MELFSILSSPLSVAAPLLKTYPTVSVASLRSVNNIFTLVS